MDDIETIPYASTKRENNINDRETIVYASPRRESDDEIDDKIYKEPKQQLRLKNKLQKETKIFKRELEQETIDIQVSRECDIKKRRRTIKS